MATDVRIVLEADDNLTPALKKSLKELQSLDKEVDKVDASLTKLKTDKKSVISGAITSDIASVKKLQGELKTLQAELASSERTRSKKEVASDISRKKALIEREYNKELNKTNRALVKNKQAATAARNASNKLLAAEKKHTAQLKKTTAVRSSATNSLVRHIRQLESAAVAYYATQKAMQMTVGFGVQLNRQYEDQKIGLAALLAAKTSDITSTGRQVDAIEKFRIAQEQTKNVLDEIKLAATETPASFAQMTGFFQQAIGHALAAGDAFGESIGEINTNVIQLTKRMSNLGAGIGMDMNLVNEEIRSLMSGNVSRDSILSLILFGDPAAANAGIKEARKRTNGLTKLLEDALDPFSALEGVDTYTKLMARMKAAYEDIARMSTEKIFVRLKVAIKNVTDYMNNNQTEIVNLFNTIENRVTAVAGAVWKVGDGVGKFVTEIVSGIGSIMGAITDSDTNPDEVLNSWLHAFNLFGGLAENARLAVEIAFKGIEYTITNYAELTSLGLNKVYMYAYESHIGYMKQLDSILNTSFFKEKIRAARAEWSLLFVQNAVTKTGIQDVTDKLKEETRVLALQVQTLDVLGIISAYNLSLREKSTVQTQEETDAAESLVQEQQALADAIQLTNEAMVDAQTYNQKLGGGLDHLIAKYKSVKKAMDWRDLARDPDDRMKPGQREVVVQYYENMIKETYEKTEESKTRKKFETEYNRMTLDSFEFEKRSLDEAAAYYAIHVKDKLAVGEWYQLALKNLKEKENKDEQDRLKNIENSINRVYRRLEDTLVAFVEKGKFEFKEMVNAILADLARIAIQQQIIQPLAGFTMDFFNPSAHGNVLSNGAYLPVHAYAQGGVVSNNYTKNYMNTVKKYASGGIVSSPTLFPMSTGTGLMGEAGPEAIMPLTRIGGDLGVKAIPAKVIINVSNESGLPMDLEAISQSQNQDGDTIIDTVLHHMAYNPDFRAAMRGG